MEKKLTFELLVVSVVEFSNLFRCGAIRVVPNIVINGAIPIETVFDLDRSTMISDLFWLFRRRLLLHALMRGGTNMPFFNYDC